MMTTLRKNHPTQLQTGGLENRELRRSITFPPPRSPKCTVHAALLQILYNAILKKTKE